MRSKETARDRRFQPSSKNDLCRLSARSWEAKFGAGDHCATDRLAAGLAAVLDDLHDRAEAPLHLSIILSVSSAIKMHRPTRHSALFAGFRHRV